MSRFSEEIETVPRGAWLLAGLSIPAVAAVFLVMVSSPGGIRPIGLLVMALIAAVFASYVLIIGYIAADARRRGMPVLLWTLLAIFVPSAIGIILYFILRRPLLRACSQCGTPADAAYRFCSACGATLGNSCPACQSPVESFWAHCAKCGAALQNT
jgi:hypothetical protein